MTARLERDEFWLEHWRGAEPGLRGRFHHLTPEVGLAAISLDGRRAVRAGADCHSLENRVFEYELEGGRVVVAKFYRPGRWSREALLDEHRFLAEAAAAGVPVVPPLDLGGGETLREAEGVRFALFDRVEVDQSERALSEAEYRETGRLIARLHNVGARREAAARPRLTPVEYGLGNLRYLLATDVVPVGLRAAYTEAIHELVERSEPLFRGVPLLRIHADFYFPGNLVSTSSGFRLIDFDDFLNGPAMQDIYLFAHGNGDEFRRQVEWLEEGYREIRPLDPGWRRLIAPLRALRSPWFSAWTAARWDDPRFRAEFTWFAEPDYWPGRVKALRAAIETIIAEGCG